MIDLCFFVTRSVFKKLQVRQLRPCNGYASCFYKQSNQSKNPRLFDATNTL